MKKRTIQAALVLAVVAGTSTLSFCQSDNGPKEIKGTAAEDHAGHDHAAEGKKPSADGHDDHSGGEKAHADEVKLSEAAVKQNNIRVARAETKDLTASFVAPSRVSFNTEAMAHVGSVVSGRVTEIKVRVGDKVKKGDELLIVESPELGRAQSEFLQRRTEAEITTAATQPAKDSYDRAKKLYDESQGIAFSEVQKRDVEYRSAVGNAASSKAALQAAENSLHLYGLSNEAVKKLAETGEINPRFEIRAPIDGKVVDREVTLGELVSPEKEKLLVLSDTSSYWVMADVPEARLADIGVGSKAEVQLAALPGERIQGEVSLVSSEIDANTRTAQLRIVVQNAEGKLRPGMFAKSLIFSGKTGEGTTAIPEEAVQTVEGKPSVFVPVEGEKNTFARREVMVGRPTGGFVSVTSGLKAGESVVISGSFILKAELGKSEAGHEH